MILPGLTIVNLKKKYGIYDWDDAVEFYISVNKLFMLWKHNTK